MRKYTAPVVGKHQQAEQGNVEILNRSEGMQQYISIVEATVKHIELTTPCVQVYLPGTPYSNPGQDSPFNVDPPS